MKAAVTTMSSTFKFIFFLLVPFLLMAVVSCDGSDPDDDKVEPEKYGNFISFSIIGQAVTGDFKIGKESPTDEGSGNSAGEKIPGEQKIRLTYSDIDQDIGSQIIFPTRKGSFKIKDFFPDDSEGRLSVFVGEAGRIGESGTITVSDIRFSGSGSNFKLSVKGTFEGVVENFDLNLNQQFLHEVSGKFEFDNY